AANAFESEALAAHLTALPPGALVLVSSSGDAGAFLTQEAVEALRGIGADVTLDGLRGNYFALAGVQGAPAGTAAQVIDPADAFLRISLDRDRRPLSAAVDFIGIERAGAGE
ncbi:MAG: interleukin-like EMT inducer domain-containing protein, partial [Caldilineaceae bacterium]